MKSHSTTPDTQFLQMFALKLCEDPKYSVTLSDTHYENGGIELAVVFHFDRSMGSYQMSLDLSDLRHEFPHGVSVGQMKTPVWITPNKGFVHLLCFASTETKVEETLPVAEESRLVRLVFAALQSSTKDVPDLSDMNEDTRTMVISHIKSLVVLAKQ